MFKKILLVAFSAILSISGAVAQVSFHLGGGYNYTNIPFKPLNQILSTYNEHYQPDVQLFTRVSNIFGPELTAGIGFGSLALNLNWNTQKIRSEATFLNGAVQGLDVQLTTYSLNFGAYPHTGDVFTFGLGLALDFGRATFNTYYYDPMTDPFYYDPIKQPMMNIGPELQIYAGLSKHMFIYARAYYKISVLDTDYQLLADRIIPLLPKPIGTDYKGDLRNGGVSLGLMISIN